VRRGSTDAGSVNTRESQLFALGGGREQPSFEPAAGPAMIVQHQRAARIANFAPGERPAVAGSDGFRGSARRGHISLRNSLVRKFDFRSNLDSQ
jgi:hypothetical protein